MFISLICVFIYHKHIPDLLLCKALKATLLCSAVERRLIELKHCPVCPCVHPIARLPVSLCDAAWKALRACARMTVYSVPFFFCCLSAMFSAAAADYV